jgi:AmpD protein
VVINGYDDGCVIARLIDKPVKLDPSRERLLGARQVPSPNCDDRPEGCEISLIVIHGISLPPGKYGGPEIDAFFTNHLETDTHPYFAEIAHLRVSSHLLVRRDGEVVQYVPFRRRAWHAGESSFDGCSACNDFSIGIELEGQDEEPYTPEQYERLAEVIHTLIEAFPELSVQRLAGHCDIAPLRKTDPGPAFDWGQLRQRLAACTS